MLSVLKNRPCGGGWLIVLGLVWGPPGSTGAAQDAVPPLLRTSELAEPTKVITLRIGEELWHFAPATDGVGIDVAVETRGEQTIEIKLGIDPPIGRVVDLVVNGRELQPGRSVIGLGVAAKGKDSGGIEYHMYEYLEWVGKPPSRQRWSPIGPLITRPADDPFDSMAIGLPGGDSIYLSLLDLIRPDGNADSVESHLFVNHCPASSSAKQNLLGTSDHQTTTTHLFKSIKPWKAPP